MRYCILLPLLQNNAEVMTCLSSCLISNELDWGHSALWLFRGNCLMTRKYTETHPKRVSIIISNTIITIITIIIIIIIIIRMIIIFTVCRPHPHCHCHGRLHCNASWLMTIIIIYQPQAAPLRRPRSWLNESCSSPLLALLAVFHLGWSSPSACKWGMQWLAVLRFGVWRILFSAFLATSGCFCLFGGQIALTGMKTKPQIPQRHEMSHKRVLFLWQQNSCTTIKPTCTITFAEFLNILMTMIMQSYVILACDSAKDSDTWGSGRDSEVEHFMSFLLQAAAVFSQMVLGGLRYAPSYGWSSWASLSWFLPLRMVRKCRTQATTCVALVCHDCCVDFQMLFLSFGHGRSPWNSQRICPGLPRKLPERTALEFQEISSHFSSLWPASVVALCCFIQDLQNSLSFPSKLFRQVQSVSQIPSTLLFKGFWA